MKPVSLSAGRRAAVVAVVALAGIAVTLRADRSSEARANRLHRADRLAEARAVYEELASADPLSARRRYNLGTTLLRTDEPETFTELGAASAANDDDVRVHALYNMGLWSLIRALYAQETDSVLFHAARSVESNKSALRIDPSHPNAGWNLVLAQRVLETAAPEPGMDDPGDINGPDNIGERLESPNPQDLASREGFEAADAAAEGEALAGDSLLPLSPTEAERIVGRGHLDPSTLIDKLFNREGRALRRRGIYVEGPPW